MLTEPEKIVTKLLVAAISVTEITFSLKKLLSVQNKKNLYRKAFCARLKRPSDSLI